MRGNARKYPDKKLSAEKAEANLIHYLDWVRPHLRASITVDTIISSYAVTHKVATYRLTLAQNRWAAEIQSENSR